MTTANGQLIMLMIAAAITLGVNITRAMAGGHADILERVGIFFAIALSVDHHRGDGGSQRQGIRSAERHQ